jgi:hypothetical protein
VAIDERARDPSIEETRVGAVMRFRKPPADSFISFKKALDPQPMKIISPAPVTPSYGGFRVEKVL